MRDTVEALPEGLLDSLRVLTDDELITRLKSLAARERRATAVLVAHLAELDTRDVYLRAGYSSLLAYCRDVLALSDGEAYNRIEVARAARRFPMVLGLLCSGDVSLTSLRLLAPHLTPENHRAILESARGKKKGGVEEIVARLAPRADVAASTRRLPVQKSVSRRQGVESASDIAGTGASEVVQPGAVSAGSGPGPVMPVPVPSGGRRPVEVEPLAPDRYRYQLTIGGSTLEKLRLAKDMMRHAVPTGDDETVLDRALTALLEELARKKFGADNKTGSRTGASPASVPGSSPIALRDSRYVPTAVKRAVWLRDLGRCAFVGTDGHRCGERAFVEFHHLRPYAVGGPPTVENIELRCRRHNGYEERLYFARDRVDPRPDAEFPGVSSRTAGSPACSGTSSSGRGDCPAMWMADDGDSPAEFVTPG